MKVHQVKTRLVNSYVIEYPHGLCVVDVAVKCHRYVLGFIEQTLNRPISDVKLVTCTHDDIDHIGGVASLAALSGAELAIPHAAGRTFVKQMNNPAGAITRLRTSFREGFRPRAWDMYLNKERDRLAARELKLEKRDGESTTASELKGALRLRDQQSLPHFGDWQVIHTPGHSWDSCCYYHRGSGSLITGDTILASGKLNSLVLPSIYSSRIQTRQSLKKLDELAVNTVYPGHGSVLSDKQIIRRHLLS